MAVKVTIDLSGQGFLGLIKLLEENENQAAHDARLEELFITVMGRPTKVNKPTEVGSMEVWNGPYIFPTTTP